MPRGELGALRGMDCEFRGMAFNVRHSFYWRRGGHLKATKTQASARLSRYSPRRYSTTAMVQAATSVVILLAGCRWPQMILY